MGLAVCAKALFYMVVKFWWYQVLNFGHIVFMHFFYAIIVKFDFKFVAFGIGNFAKAKSIVINLGADKLFLRRGLLRIARTFVAIPRLIALPIVVAIAVLIVVAIVLLRFAIVDIVAVKLVDIITKFNVLRWQFIDKARRNIVLPLTVNTAVHGC